MQKIIGTELYRTGLKYFELDDIIKTILKPIIAGDDKAEDFEDSLKTDPDLSRKIILRANQQLKNGSVQSLAHAVVLIGKNRVRDFVLANHILSFSSSTEERQIVGAAHFLKRADETESFAKKLGADFSGGAWAAGFLFDLLENLLAPQIHSSCFSPEWNHARKTAAIAFSIANISKLPSSMCRQAFLAGLTHDIGRLLLCISYPNESLQIFAEISQARHSGLLVARREIEIEKSYLNKTHCEVGSMLLSLSDFLSEIEEVVNFHHDLDLLKSRGSRLLQVAEAIHLADELAEKNSENSLLDHEQISSILKKNNDSLKLQAASVFEMLESLKIKQVI